MVLWLYSLSVKIYGLLILVLRPFNKKAKKWIAGRQNIWTRIIQDTTNPIWIHAASLGEFEQGRPVIEAIKKQFPDTRIVLTFFSPSGYEIRKNYQFVDHVFYLPLDTKKNAVKFLNRIKPRAAIFIKYDFWFNYLDELNQRNIPFYFISCVFKSNHFLFKPWLSPLLEILQKSKMIFVQDIHSHELLERKQINSMVAGDNRIDRVIDLQGELKKYPIIDSLIGTKSVVIFGSIWPADLEIVAAWIAEFKEKYFTIFAPHDISAGMLKRIQQQVKGNYPFLTGINNSTRDADGIIVNTIGDLAHLYQYGTQAYIGGGFGKGIHSILEPIAAGLPVIFGPHHQKFGEATELIKLSSAQSVSNSIEFKQAIDFFSNNSNYKLAGEGIHKFLSRHRGATLKVVHYLAGEKILL
ncbi:MAG: 3-deoxy-D-manno-octulosonic acid transferase [Saprospiraceae bacterium]|nr:3-deoxy-D-manno-octulosonic acid transferase [Saprospiraceae bacterium]